MRTVTGTVRRFSTTSRMVSRREVNVIRSDSGNVKAMRPSGVRIEPSTKAVAALTEAWRASAVSLGLGSYGVYLGRVERWNSWDLLHRPAVLLRAAARPFVDPFGNERAVVMSIVFFGFLLTAYLAS